MRVVGLLGYYLPISKINFKICKIKLYIKDYMYYNNNTF